MTTHRLAKRLSALKKSRKAQKLAHSQKHEPRRLNLEALEDRRVMAVTPPVFILPNNGVLLNQGETRTIAPRDLTFRFTELNAIDPATIPTGIILQRAGQDGVFGNANDVRITPGFIGLGTNAREVVMRFADNLPDDTYRVTIVGAGMTPLRDTAGNPFNGAVNFVLDFRLDLGAQVLAVVPQPVTRQPNGTLQQARNQIVVYFNNDDLNVASAQRPEFYRLYLTHNTLDPNDDEEILPTQVVYNATADTATLTFGQVASLEQLAPDDGSADPAKSFRLRIGTDEQRRALTTTTRLEGNDPGSSFATAFDIGNAITAGTQGSSAAFAQAIEAQFFGLAWPGDGTDPGHRDIPAEVHLNNPPDSTAGITTFFYNFQPVIGVIPDGVGGSQPAFNLITAAQKQRAREIFDLYSRYAGVQFVESANQGLTIATGDMRAIDPTVATGPGGVIGLADPLNGIAIMDNAETWNDQFGIGSTPPGLSWFDTAMHEIGHLLGLGHSYDLPPHTVQGEDGRLLFAPTATPSAPGEPIFPGDADITHMQVLYRPESKDIDMYRFVLDGTGVFSAEAFADRLPNSSGLDTTLTLYRQTSSGARELIARNDDYFSKDSYLELQLGPGTYFVGISASGNDTYDPTIDDSGIGGTTQGAYELKFNFRKSATQSIVDAVTPANPSPVPLIPDTLAVAFDGNNDGTPGGVHNFWFRAAAPRGAELAGKARTLFVDKSFLGTGSGSLSQPFNNIATALAAARPFDIIRIVGNGGADNNIDTLGDNRAYRIGFDEFGQPLADGVSLNVPKDVTVMIDAGAIFQMRRSQISVGSTAPSIASDRSGGALQVLGIPGAATKAGNSVYFTSFNEVGPTGIGLDTNPLNIQPAPGDWGGLSFKSDLDRADGRFEHENVGVFLNYVNHADLRYGGGQVNVNSVFEVVTPVAMTDMRPTVTNNLITRSADAAISANPDSFEETNFQAPKHWPAFAGPTTSGVAGVITKTTAAGLSFGINAQNGAINNVALQNNEFYQAGFPVADFGLQLGTDTTTFRINTTNGLAQIPATVTDAGSSVLVTGTFSAGGVTIEIERRYEFVADLNVLRTTTTLRNIGTIAASNVRLFDAFDPDQGASANTIGDGLSNTVNDILTLSGLYSVAQATNGRSVVIGDAGIEGFLASLDIADGSQLNAFFAAPFDPNGTSQDVGLAIGFEFNLGVGESTTLSFDQAFGDSAGQAQTAFLDAQVATGPAPAPTGSSASFTLDYKRVGPEIHGNTLVQKLANGTVISNSTNGLFVRTTTPAGSTLEELTVTGRFDDTDIVHVLQENLVIRGTPSGPTLETVAPPTTLIVPTVIAGGNFATATSTTIEYKLVYMDLLGNEGLASATIPINLAAGSSGRAVQLANLPIPTGEFVARRLYRRIDTGEFTLVDQIPAQVTTYVDRNLPRSGTLQSLRVLATPSSVARPRLDASLTIDPSIIVKNDGARIEVGIGAQLLAEAVAGQEVIFTSLFDDRYGAGGTFDTPNDNTDVPPKVGAEGDWGGIYFSPDATGSLDHVRIAFAGGLNRIEGTFAGFNPIEIRQADVRIANSEFERNANGQGGQSPADRFGRGFNADAIIFVRGAQPVIVNNLVHDNDAAFINVNVNALNSNRVVDLGRQTGLVDRLPGHLDNHGPLIDNNQLSSNATNGMIVRGGTLTTEGVWDDTDIVHVLLDGVNVTDFHTFGGLRLESSPVESLVVKAFGAGAGITATGRPLEIDDRIGGIIQILGQPGFPVVLTSLTDDTVGAGVTLEGVPQVDTNGDGLGGGLLPIGPEVDNGTLIDNDVDPNTVGHFEVRPAPGGSIGFAVPNSQSGVTAQGQSMLFANTDFVFEFLNYIDVGPAGGAIDLSTTTITTPPTLSPTISDLVFSEGSFAGANGTVNWRVETRLDDGVATVFNTLFLSSTQPLGALQFINYLDEDVLLPGDDILYQVGSPGQANFRLFTLDNQERIGFSQGGIYTAGPGLTNATYNGWAADKFADLRTIITGAGTTYSPTGNIDTVDLQPFTDPALGNVHGLADVTTAMAWTVNPLATTATITSFLELVPRAPVSSGRPGDWQGITIDQWAHDRNVATILERESVTSDGLVNSVPDKAQVIGQLATIEKGGDETLRLGFTIQGVVNNPNDLDVYSFTGQAGTEVWIDIDRTTQALDTIVELIDNLGNVLARSDNSPAESGGSESPEGISLLMQKTPPYEGTDYYTTNPRDGGMRLVLPGPANTTNTYFLRVRSNAGVVVTETTQGAATANEVQRVTLRGMPTGGAFTLTFNGETTAPIAFNATAGAVQTALEDLPGLVAGDVLVTGGSSGPYDVEFRGAFANTNVPALIANADALHAGLTTGAYQLQLRLREVDEIGGSTIQFANIRNAVNGIKVLGQPTHSPLAGEHTEINNTANNAPTGAQLLGNLLNSDRGARSVAGVISSLTDVDWYQLDINYDATQGTGIEDWWSTIFDLDFADGFARPNAVISIFDANGDLVLTSRDSNIGDDRPNPLDPSNVSDLGRGSAGAADPWIGPTEMPQGTYLVAISNDAQMPQALTQFFAANATNPLVRLEPVNSVNRIAEEHFDVVGGATAAPPEVPVFIDDDSIIPWHLGDISLYVTSSNYNNGSEQSQILLVDPLTGSTEINFGAVGPQNFPFEIGDLAFRSDNGLFALELDMDGADLTDDADSGRLLQIDHGTGDLITRNAATGIQTYEPDPMAMMPPPMAVQAHLVGQNRIGWGIQFQAMAFGAVNNNGNAEALLGVGNRGEAASGTDGLSDIGGVAGQVLNPWLQRRRNIVYQLDTTTGAGVGFVPPTIPLSGAATQILELGEILTAARIIVGQSVNNPTDATSFSGGTNTTNFNLNDGLTFTVNDGLGDITFEFDTGPEVRQRIPAVGDLLPPAPVAPAPADDSPFTNAQFNLLASNEHINDGDFFILGNVSTGDEGIYHFDTGVSFTVQNATLIQDGDFFSITNSANPPVTTTFEFDNNMMLGQGQSTAINIAGLGANPSLTLAGRIAAAINPMGGGQPMAGALGALQVGTRIVVTGETGMTGLPLGLSMDSEVGDAPVLQAVAGGLIPDGGFFRVTANGSAGQITVDFEFENPDAVPFTAGVTAGRQAINVDNTMTAADVADAIVTALNTRTAINTIPWDGTANLGAATTLARLAGTDRIVLNAQNIGYNRQTSPINNLLATITDFPISTTSVATVDPAAVIMGGVEENTSARPIGLAVQTIVNQNTSPFFASFAHQRINFPPQPGGGNVDTRTLDASGVSAWQTTAATFGVAPTHVTVPLHAADLAGVQFFPPPGTVSIAERIAAAINGVFPQLNAAASGPTVQLSSGSITVQSPLTTQGEGPGGTVTGMANLRGQLWAVSTSGGLYRVNVAAGGLARNRTVASSNEVSTTYIRTSADDLRGIQFQGLTIGPQDVEGGRYRDMLFGIDINGRVYAFDTNGVLQPVFLNGQTFIDTGITNAHGLAFSTLEDNLFHETPNAPTPGPNAPVDGRPDNAAVNERQGDAGHGILPVFDRSRAPVGGRSSLHFGIGTNGQYDGEVAQGGGSTNLPGGAYGTVVTNEFSLKGYSFADQPTLYFNYFAGTEGREDLLTDGSVMRDSFRVYITNNSGQWELLGTNNSARAGGSADDEADYRLSGFSNRIEEVFDNTGGWRQVRIDLGGYAGQSNLRLRFEYASAGTIDTGNPNTAGDELRAVAGEFLDDGQIFNIGGTNFEIEMGYSLHVSSGSAYVSQEGRTFTLGDGTTTQTFEITFDPIVAAGNRPVLLDANMTPADVSQQIISAIIGVFGGAPFGAPLIRYLRDAANAPRDTVINLPLARTLTNNLTIPGFQTGAFGVTNGIQVNVHREMTRVEVADSINNVLETVFYNQQIVARAPFDPPLVQNGPQTQQIFDGSTFTITPAAAGGTPVTFEFESGFVLSVPSLGGAAGAAADRVQDESAGPGNFADGFSLTLGGVTQLFQFESDGHVLPGGHRIIPINAGMNQLAVAQAIASTINGAFGVPGLARVLSGSRVQLDTQGDATAQFIGGRFFAATPTTVSPAVGGKYAGGNVVGSPGVAPGNQRVLFSPSTTFTAQQMAQAISNAINASATLAAQGITSTFAGGNSRRVTLAGPDVTVTTTIPGLALEVGIGANDVVKQHQDLIHVIGRSVNNPGPLGLAAYTDLTLVSQRGIEAQEFGSFSSELRAQNNVVEGIYIDDIVIGFAERGEMVTGGTNTNTAFVGNPRALATTIPVGSYQFEARRASDYGLPIAPPTAPLPHLGLYQTFNSNDRLTPGRALYAPNGSKLADGQFFTLSDGINQVTFEFNDASISPISGVLPGRIPINYFPTDTDFQIAQRVRDAINTPAVQAVVDIQAQLGDSVLGTASTSNQVNLIGPVSLINTGALNFFAFQTPINDHYSDRNLFRDQGQIILHGNRITDSSEWGILIDNAPRTAADGNTPHQGPVGALAQPNTQRLVPGVVVTNNVIANNTLGGILFSGDPATDAPVSFGRITNNTLFGLGGSLTGGTQSDIGIRVEQNSAPTLMNNIIANFNLGISVDNTSLPPNTVLGGNLFQGNDNNSNIGVAGGGGDFPIVLTNAEPLFVNAAAGNFYLKAQSRGIDSSVDSLLDRPALVTVKSPLGILPSPILSPDRDGVGQLRVDDPSVATPNGFGLNPFKDRGAIDRVDFTGSSSQLINPQDNDADGVDLDTTTTVVVLQNQIVRDFTIALLDRTDPNGPVEGSDIDDTTVTASQVVVEVLNSDGTVTLLQQGVSYSFSYDATNNLIRLTPLGGLWPLSQTYRITLNNNPLTGIADNAGNILSANQTNGSHIYTIFLGTAVDWGDAPDTYGTTTGANGANHQIVAGMFLGTGVSADPDGKPSVDADQDNLDDGIVFGNLQPGGGPNSSQISVVASLPGFLDGWIDLNADGDFDANEHVLQAVALVGGAGVQDVRFQIPPGLRTSTIARFRYTSTGIATPTGPAADGEVEDYRVILVGPQFQNGVNQLDVNNDTAVSPIDALLVLNFIHFLSQQLLIPGGNLPLPITSPPYFSTTPPIDPTGGGIAGQGRFLDVNGDGFLSGLDALLVINKLNEPPEGEGESAPLLAAGALPAGAAATRNDSPAIPATLLAGPSIEFEVRETAVASPAGIAADALQDAENSQLGLALLALDQASRRAHRGPQTPTDVLDLDDELSVGPLAESSWDDLLTGLAHDRGRHTRNPRQAH